MKEEPGKYPFTRGIYKDMYKGRLWTMRQYAGFATAEETNRRFQYLLNQGQTGLSVAFHLPTQIGYDSDHPLAVGEVGKVGVPIDTLKDMEILFKDIPLDKASVSMTINSTAPIVMAMYIALAKKQGVDLNALRGTVQNDILKEYVARGTYIFPPAPSMRLCVDLIEYCSRNLAKWNPISVSGYHIREAGATAAQELAFTLANGIEYLTAARLRGLDADKIAERFSFFFASHSSFLEEVAKFRAARRLWAKIVKEKFWSKNEEACKLRFHVQTSGSVLTMEQPLNNIARVALQALAAILGGAQSLHTNSYDEAYATPSENAVTIALRTQQIIAHETGITESSDPLGGSYHVEKLTDFLEEAAKKYINTVDQLGGAVYAIEAGYIQREIQESSYLAQMKIEQKKRIVVGVNEFRSAYQEPENTLKLDPKIGEKQIESLKLTKNTRNQTEVKASLSSLEKAAKGQTNTMPAIIDCVEALATVGEISDVLRNIFGEYREM